MIIHIKNKGEIQMKNQSNPQNEKGITLISLAVTMVVIFILAGITVDLSLQDNSLIKTALGLQNSLNATIENNQGTFNELYQEGANRTNDSATGLQTDINWIESDEEVVIPPSVPRVVISGTQGESGYYKSEVGIIVTASNTSHTLTYIVEGTDRETSINSGNSIQITQDGTYTIHIYEYNSRGEKSEAATVTITRDMVAPIGTLQVTSAGETTIDVQLVSTDPEPSSGLASSNPYTFYYKAEGENSWTEAGKGSTSSYTYTGLQSSTTYTLKAEITDKAGNVGTSNEVSNIQTQGKIEITGTTDWTNTQIKQNDETSFTITVSKPSKVSDTPNVTLEPNTTGSTVAIEAVNPDTDGYATQFKVTVTGGNGNGQESVTIGTGTLVDNNGNTTETSITKQGITVDNTLPSIGDISNPNEGTIIQENETIQIIITTSEQVTVDQSKVIVTGDGNEGATVQVTQNTDNTITITVTGGTGTGTIGIEIQPGAFTDEAGNTNETITIDNIVSIDNQAPTVVANITAQTTSSITVAVRANDNGPAGLATTDTFTYYITGEGIDKSITTTDTSYTFTNLPDKQEYTITVTAIDSKGNSATSTAITGNTDTVPEGQASITVSGLTWNGNGTPEQEGTAKITLTNNQTDFAMQYQIITDGSTPVEENWIDVQGNSVELDGLEHNTIIYTRLLDETGNAGTVGTTTIQDTTQPTAGTLTLKQNNENGTNYTGNSWTNQNVYVTLNGGSDLQSGVQSNVVTATSTDTVGEIATPTTITTEGTTTLTVTTTDWAGLRASSTTYTINIDQTEPTISSLTKSIEETTNQDMSITGTAQDTLSGLVAYQYSTLDNLTANSTGWTTIDATTETYTAPAYTISTNGTYYFYVKDQAGNVTKQEIEIQNIDKTNPTVTSIEGPSQSYIKNHETVTYTITTSEPTIVIGEFTNNSAITLTGDGATGCTSQIEVVNADENGYTTEYVITVTGGTGNGSVALHIGEGLFQDNANNGNEASSEKAGLTIDNTAPTMEINPTSHTITNKVDVTITVKDNSAGLHPENSYTYFVSKDQNNPMAEGYVTGTYESGTAFSIGEGLTGEYYLFATTIQDAVGNASIETISGYYRTGPYTFDNTAPTVTSVITSNPGTDGFTVTIQATDNDGGSGIASENAYTIYYKTSKATGYSTPVKSSSNVYTLKNLAPTIADADITQDEANEPYLQAGMNPVIWVDLNGNGTIEESTEEIVKYSNVNNKTINSKWTANHGDDIWAVYNSLSVTYDVYVTVTDKAGNTSEGVEAIQQTITPAIDHKTSHFANVKMEDGSYFTWIPRYAYKITEQAPNTTASVSNTGYMDIKFVKDFSSTAYDGTECIVATSNINSSTQYVVHPAFCENVDMGGYGTNVSGIWVAKYESSMETDGVATSTSSATTGNVITDDHIKVVSKPNRTSWRYITIGNCYTNAYNYNVLLDSHMIKNSEWGAVSYLTHSQYGRNGNEVAKNDSTLLYTGRSMGKPAASGSSEQGTYTYNVENGMLASTTGNIYGVYDMSGGAYEYTAAWDTKSSSDYISNNGNSFATKGGTSTKYITAYHIGTSTNYPTSEISILGDATYEVNLLPGNNTNAWFNDFSGGANNEKPYFIRGGAATNGVNAGIYHCTASAGGAGDTHSFRIVIPGEQQFPTDGSWSEEKGVNTPQVSGSLNPVMWIDLDNDGTIEIETEEIKKYNDMTTKTINPVWETNNGDSIWYDYTNNGQTLASKVDHKQSKWANVVDEDTGSYFVWVPRYAYKITATTNTTPSVSNAGMIDVQFVKNDTAQMANGNTATIATSNIDTTTKYVVHPAFCADVNMGGYGTNLSGIWVAKYESSMETNGVATSTTDTKIGNVTTNASVKVVSKPNRTSWGFINIGNSYTNAYNYNRSLDSHLIKNSEWGATAYLTHSSYGRNGNEIAKNNSSLFYTGRSSGKAAVSGSNEQGDYTYNETNGMLASTTGNIYGIYDMSGGTYEYIAAWDTKSTSSYITNYGSSFASKGGSSTKYATVYNNGMSDSETGYRNPTMEKGILGDDTYEVCVNPGNSLYAWFNDNSTVANSTKPFFIRSGESTNGSGAGVFYVSESYGGTANTHSYRIVLPGTGNVSKDTTRPTMTISPSSTSTAVKNTNVVISITDTGYSSGLASGNTYQYYLSTSSTNPKADGYVQGTYKNGVSFNIGSGLTGTYYLYVQQIFDNNGNGNVTNANDGDIKYHKVGTYIFDNSAPTITAVGAPSKTYIKQNQTATYSITTSESVTIADSAKATANGCTVAITGSGTSWTATVTGGSGNGAVTLSLAAGLFKDTVGNVTTAASTKTGLTLDNTAPVFTVSPTSGTVVKSRNVTVSITETGAGLATTNSYKYYLSTSSTNPTASGYKTGSYTSGTAFSIGSGLTGTYYLFLPVIQDTLGNTSTATITGYYRTGTYVFDNKGPTVNSVVTSKPGTAGFTVTITASDQGSAGLATTSGYTIYYKQSGASSYSSVTSTSNTYTFTGLSPSASYANIAAASANVPDIQTGMNPVIWVDLNGNGTIETATEEIVKYSNLTNQTINSAWTNNNGDSVWCSYRKAEAKYDVYVTAKDTLGNVSEKSSTVSATLTQNTWDHKKSQWANVKMTDGSYFVWIPRYPYKITPTTATSSSNTTRGTIDVKFINGTGSTAYDGTACTIATSNIDSTSQYVVHPAFCTNVNMGGFGSNVKGIWVAKYEASGSASAQVFQPNKTAFRSLSTGGMYNAGKAYNSTLNSHMMKNSEWGAVAYLTHSQYGRNANQITINNSSDYITGNAGASVSAASAAGTVNSYNTANGMLASTTGNITGIYDMSGGSWEYVAGFNNEANSYSYTSSYGWSGLSTSSVSDKWATKYFAGSSNVPSSSSCILGDGIYEVTVSSSGRAWFNDANTVCYKSYPFSIRGGVYTDGGSCGIFASSYGDGWASWGKASFRVVLIK